jgi:hypothetical protein
MNTQESWVICHKDRCIIRNYGELLYDGLVSELTEELKELIKEFKYDIRGKEVGDFDVN